MLATTMKPRFSNLVKPTTWLIVIFIFLLVAVSTTQANPDDFVSTSKQMIERLDCKPTKTRAFIPYRGISVIKKNDNTLKKNILSACSTKIDIRITFDSDSATITHTSTQLLNELAIALNSPKLKERRFLVCGHTDSDGSSEYNLRLSLNRALSVRDYLVVHHHIQADRLDVYGCGEFQPLYSNNIKNLKQFNRRVEIRTLQ